MALSRLFFDMFA